jgi:trimeric autotransporter adhesin
MRHIRSKSALSALLLLTVMVSGCGDDDPEPVPEPPPTPGDTVALTSANRLVTFNRAAPAVRTAVAITGLQAGENLLGIDIRPGGATAGELYGLSSAGRLYTISVTTGAAALKSTLTADPADTTAPFASLDGSDFGLDFNPVPDRLRVVSSSGQNLRINVDSGATFTDTSLTSAGAARAGVTATAYTNSFAAACRTALFYIDSTTDRLLTTADPNGGVVSDVGAIGVDAAATNGFEIATGSDGTNSAVAVLTVGGAPTLHTINLGTGAATSVGAVTGLNAGESIRGLAAAPPATAPAQATGELLGVTEANRVVSFNSGAPQKLCTTAAITGLQTSENVLGIDVRPADGALYALGSSGRVYTVAPSTGAATLKATLSADATDTTNPFTALDGSDFAIDFNPVPDRLRVVSGTGQNLRINVDTGATFTDASINPAGSSVFAGAYSNSFAGAATTTLYVLDATADRLQVQGQPSGNPNNGDLATVGSLGLAADVQSAGGFDINGRNNAALAALNVVGSTASELHSINLTTGAATRVNTIGGGERLRGMTFAAQLQTTGFAVTTDNRLLSFKVGTPGMLDSNIPVSGLQGGENIVTIDFRPATGRLHALTDGGRLYVIDPATAVASGALLLAADAGDTTSPFTALSGPDFGSDFNPVVDRLRTVSSSEQNLRTNVDSGATFTDATLNRAPFAATAAAYTNAFAGATATTLYVIDTRNDRLVIQNPPNNGTLADVGPLGLDADGVAGFDIAGPDTAIAVLSSSANPTGFYQVNLTTGAATLVGRIGLANSTDRVSGVAAVPSVATPAADSSVVALINGSSLVRFARNAPPAAAAPIAITGLTSGETLLAIDFRPATGVLYGLGSAGRLYTIEPTTAVASVASTLVADPADATEPFTALSGTSFGIDFNPVPDRLRVVSDAGQNLRINVASGATFTDGALNVPSPDVAAAAYTRNFAGTTATQLLLIDVATNSLLLQNPPNDGVLTPIGRLDSMLTFTGVAGFDIVGGEDGLALAALQPTGAAQSTLYRINLRTGATTAIGVIGGSATPLIRDFAIRLQ